MTLLLALLYLAALGISGVAALRRLTCRMTTLEKWAYGLPLGNVVWSLVILALAIVFRRLTLPIVVVSGVASVAVAVWLWPWREIVAALRPARPDRAAEADPLSPAEEIMRFLRAVGVLSSIVLLGFAVRWTFLWAGAFTTDTQGLWAGHIYIWGDWALHLGDVTSFAYGDNFPPVNSRYLGGPLAYHYLPSITAAALVKLGLAPTAALVLHSWAFCLTLLLGLYAFALRLIRDRAAAALTLVLFFLGGSLGWIYHFRVEGQEGNLWTSIMQQPWDSGWMDTQNYQWPNMFFSLIESQRAYVYGLSLALLTFTLLFEGMAQRSRRLYFVAGLVAATLPLAHTSTLVALALIMPFFVLFFPPSVAPFPALSLLRNESAAFWGGTRERCTQIFADYRAVVVDWLAFGVTWVALTVPQVIWQQGGERGETNSIRWLVGWVAPPDPWPWFWLKNLGLFVPLLAIGLLAGRRLLDGTALKLVWAFMPTFVICNLVAFRPWDWDNTKMFLYWYIAVCLVVAALLVQTWREHGTLLVRTLIVGALVTMLLSGVLVNLQQALGKDRYLFLSFDEIALAERVRANTDPQATFAVGLQHNHPVPVLAGRQVLMSYPGWLYAFGIDYAQRERDLRAIYALGPTAQQLIDGYGIDYVVIGPWERNEFKPNVAQFRARFGNPVIATQQYEVYKVR